MLKYQLSLKIHQFSTSLLSILTFSLRAACVTVMEAGSDPHVRSILIDMAESRSTSRAVPADRREPILGIKKKSQSPVFLKLFYCSEVSSITLLSQYECSPQKHERRPMESIFRNF